MFSGKTLVLSIVTMLTQNNTGKGYFISSLNPCYAEFLKWICPDQTMVSFKDIRMRYLLFKGCGYVLTWFCVGDNYFLYLPPVV